MPCNRSKSTSILKEHTAHFPKVAGFSQMLVPFSFFRRHTLMSWKTAIFVVTAVEPHFTLFQYVSELPPGNSEMFKISLCDI
jgi:hypothetical protein